LRLLLELVDAGGDIVTREELFQRIWGHDYYGDTHLLDEHVRGLRRRIEANPEAPELVLTSPDAGYYISRA
jgi:DNA-binding response OmpR family regulator